jgi:hypothetical protein
MNTPGEGPPQRVLTPRHKRAFLSFRRKSDLLWFLTSVIMFSGGTAAFVLALFFIGKTREPIPPAVAPPPLSPVTAPLAATPPPPPPLEEKSPPPETAVPAKKSGGKPVVRAGASRARPAGATNPPSSPVLKTETKPSGTLLLQQAGPFKTLVDRQAKLVVDPIESVGEPAIQLTYDLSYGDWVQCFVNVRENFSKYSRVQFLFKGEGASNTLEFKLVDSDGTNVGMVWSQQTGKKAWTVVDLPLTDLTYLWGGDSTLELKRLRQVFFAISKKPGDKGGRGRVTIRGVKFS